jgi:hypothetical protein
MPWTIYEPSTGRITGIVEGRRAVAKVQGRYVAGRYAPQDWYIDGAVPRRRPASPISCDGCALYDVPRGSRLVLNGADAGPCEGTVKLADGAAFGGDVTVRCHPWRDFTWSAPALRAARARARDYPAIGDQLDALAKAMAALRDQGVALPAETEHWLDSCAAVKARHPKQEDS